MAFKPLEEKPRIEPSDEVKIAREERDLQLEKEAAPETETETEEQKHTAETAGPQKPRPAMKKIPAIPLPLKNEIVVKIEKIMEEDLNDSYQRLSPVAKQEFKLKGEQTAAQIQELLKGTHIKVKKILGLILDWLRMLPGINRFFLEQEAKIKTDKIIALKKKE
ncbi:MAG: hypothetical protein HYT15_04125 [Candidatus Magasanikbacteria bacterium]|nr:hypothetical protein [Candidatus Magasanikbacteria bacterium]